MLSTVLNGGLGLLGLWDDCKVGKSYSVVYLLSLLVKKKNNSNILYAMSVLTVSTEAPAFSPAKLRTQT